MKKLFVAALITLSITGSAFAQDANLIAQKAVENFEAVYKGASNVTWTPKQNFAIAAFVQNSQKVEVFYNLEGDFIATTSQIKMDDLPTYAKRSFAKKYSDYTVLEAFKFQAENETGYFISAQNEKENIVLKVKQGSVSVYSRTNKN